MVKAEHPSVSEQLPYEETPDNLHWAKYTPIYKRPVVCTIIGSLRFMPVINQVIDGFDKEGIWVPAPRKGIVVNSPNDYKILDADGDTHPVEVEAGYIHCLLNSDISYIVNPNGYIGFTSAIEALIAQKFLIPVISMEPIDPSLDQDGEYHMLWKNFCKSVPCTPFEEAAKRMKDFKGVLYQYRALEFMHPREDDIETIVTQVLHMDWIKHRKLGAVVDWVNRAWRRQLIPHDEPSTRIAEFTFDDFTDTYKPEEPDKLRSLHLPPEGRVSTWNIYQEGISLSPT